MNPQSPDPKPTSRITAAANAAGWHVRLIDFVRAEMRDWPAWWAGLGTSARVWPAILTVAFWTLLLALGGFRPDHLNLGLVILVFGYGGRSARAGLAFLMPFILTGIVYDTQRYYSDFIRGEVHVRLPYEFDKTFFGISTPQGVLTPNEWCQINTRPWLDLLTGFFYLFFIGIYILITAYHRFVLPRITTDALLRAKILRFSPYATWAFFWTNVLGYTTYYWFPAAPPWYVADHGLGPAKMDVSASAAGCLRFDAILGTSFFTGMYGRSADVFGAIPSLHVAYPFLSILFAFQFKSLRAFSVFFYLIMCFSAVYLNHHYILDLIWGTTYAILIWAGVWAYARRRTPPIST